MIGDLHPKKKLFPHWSKTKAIPRVKGHFWNFDSLYNSIIRALFVGFNENQGREKISCVIYFAGSN